MNFTPYKNYNLETYKESHEKEKIEKPHSMSN